MNSKLTNSSVNNGRSPAANWNFKVFSFPVNRCVTQGHLSFHPSAFRHTAFQKHSFKLCTRPLAFTFLKPLAGFNEIPSTNELQKAFKTSSPGCEWVPLKRRLIKEPILVLFPKLHHNYASALMTLSAFKRFSCLQVPYFNHFHTALYLFIFLSP